LVSETILNSHLSLVGDVVDQGQDSSRAVAAQGQQYGRRGEVSVSRTDLNVEKITAETCAAA
jgi:hypothetical protein